MKCCVIVVLATVVALVLVGEPTGAFRTKCPQRTTLATFNAAIFPFFVGSNGTSEFDERTGILIQQIRKSDVDIFCLQEVFFADIQREIVAAVKDEFPYAFSAQNFSVQPTSNTTACTEAQLLELNFCIVQNCSGSSGRLLQGCISVSCADVLNSFGSVCRDCLLVHPAHLIENCVRSISASQIETNYGLLMLSRKELKNTKTSSYHPLGQFRGYLEASVDGVGDLICTHATSLLSTEFYAGPPVVSPLLYQRYDEQQYAELTTLFQVIVTKDMPILMGDFNHGPASPGGITWELPFLYGLMNARGFYSPYVLADGRCTFCSSNPATLFLSDIIIDHIYIPTTMSGRVISSRRILDNIRTSIATPLSDHYGIEVTLKDTKENCDWWEQWKYYCLNSPRLRFLDLVAPTTDLGRLCSAV